MKRNLACVACAMLLGLLIGCNKADQERADEKAAEAKQKTRLEAERLGQDARKLGSEAKSEAHDLGRNIDHALNSTGRAADTSEAGEKLRRGGEDLRVAGDKAAVKLDRAAMVAKIKTKLATDVGLSTVTGIDVDTTGQVVTLRGTVDSEQQRQQAEQAVLQVSGVTRVVNDLRVR